MGYLFTSESVSEGHPDKVADQISDAVLDKIIAFDPDAKVACETLGYHRANRHRGRNQNENLRRRATDRPRGNQPHRLHQE